MRHLLRTGFTSSPPKDAISTAFTAHPPTMVFTEGSCPPKGFFSLWMRQRILAYVSGASPELESLRSIPDAFP